MDKETLSNYGWIVIAVLVLVVMIALATPFGSFVSEAVQSTTKGLFDVNKNALDAAGVPGLTVQDQEFDVPDMNHGAGETPEHNLTEGQAIFGMGVKHTNSEYCQLDYHHECWEEIEPVTLTWEELLLPENGEKYFYYPETITDTSSDPLAGFLGCETLISITLPEGFTTLGEATFMNCKNLTSVTLPSGVTFIDRDTFYECTSLKNITLLSNSIYISQNAFYRCTSLESITLPKTTHLSMEAFSECTALDSIIFQGTMAEWDESVEWGWNYNCNEITVTCTDGTITIPANL